MIVQTNTRCVSALGAFSRTTSVGGMIVSTAVLAGWAMNSSLLTRVHPALESMKPLTAVAIFLTALSLWLQSNSRPDRPWRFLPLVAAWAVVLIGLTTLSEYEFGWDFGVDRLLFRHAVESETDGNLFPGRMAPATASGFLCLGLALLLAHERAALIAQGLSLVSLTISFVALIGYVYGVRSLYQLGPYVSMALHTAILFGLLSLGVLCRHLERGLMAIVTSETAGGLLARRLLPAAIGVPILLGWLWLIGQQAGLYDSTIRLVLSVLSNVIVLALVILWNAAALARTDSARLRAEEWVRNLMQASPSAMLLADRGGQIIRANSEAERLTGYSQSELLGRPLETLVAAPERRSNRGDREKFLAGAPDRPAGLSWDLFCRCKDGRDVPIEVGLNLVETSDGVLTLASLTDITERKQAMQALRESEERLRMAQQVAKIGTFEWNIQTGVNTWTPELEAMYGLRVGGFPGTQQAWEQLVHPDDRPRAVAKVQRAMEQGGFADEWRVVWPDGSTHWLAGRAFVFKDDSGRPLRLLGINIDITERKLAEQALSDSERRYRSMFQSAGVSIWEEDFTEVKAALDELWAQGVRDFRDYFAEHPEFVQHAIGLIRVLDVNDETLRMYGAREKQELLGSLDKIFVSETLPIFVEELMTIVEGRIFWQSEAVVKTLAGRRFHILFSITFPPPTGRFDRVLVSVMEITELRQALESMRESETRFRALVDASAQIVWTTEPDGLVVEDSPSWRAFTGQTYEQWRGWGWLDAFHPDDRDRVEELWREAVATKTPVNTEYRLRHVSGTWRWTAARAVPLLTSDGVVRGWVGMNIDITDRKQAELELQQARNDLELRVVERTEELETANAALRQSQTRFRQLVEHSPTAMLMVGESGKIMLVNSEAEAIFGFSRTELIGQAVEMLIPKRFRAGHVHIRENYAANSRPLRTGADRELFGLRRDGTEFPIQLGLNPIETIEGSCTLATVVDISERKRAEQKLKAIAAELEQSNADLEQFAFAASHDMQEPLRTIASFLDLLSSRYQAGLDDQAREWIDFAVQGAEQMQHLVHDLLEYSRIGSHGESFQPVNCNTVFDTTVFELKKRIEETRASVSRGTLPTVSADRAHLLRVFQNLIGNALKFHGEQSPVVRVEAARQDGEWVFSVRDNGIGIDPRFVKRLFVVFQRLHTISEYPGTGVGLAMCRRIVERHGGRIWVDSQLGQGATFSFTIPQTRPESIQPVEM